MKRFLVIIVALLMVVLSGCDSDEKAKDKAPELSKNISSMEIIIDNNLIKIQDKLNFGKLEKMGFKLDSNYEGVLEATLEPSSEENVNNKSFNIVTSDGKLVAVSVINNGKKKCKVDEGIINFIGSYSGEEYDHSYVLPGDVKYNAGVDSIKKAWGEPQLDLSTLEDSKMVQYTSDNCTFTGNLDSNGNMTGFSLQMNI